MCIRNRSRWNSLEVLALTQDIYPKVCTKIRMVVVQLWLTNRSRMREIFCCFFFLHFCLAWLCHFVKNIKQLCTWSSILSVGQPRLLLMAEAGVQERAEDVKAPCIGLLVTSTASYWLSKLQEQTRCLG